LRIISGYARGLRLKSPQGLSIRPTSDRAREALFSIINHRLQDALVLDLFAGTGAFGLEALSRGARQSIFVDNNPDAIVLIKKNLELLQKSLPNDPAQSAFVENVFSRSCRQPSLVINYDLRREKFFMRKEWKNAFPSFDVIFLDPPYAKGLSLQVVTYLDKTDFLADGGLLIAEERSDIELPDSFSALTKTDRRRYGDTVFWLYENSAPAP
jgi:16S rRNA (guanine966-N2)-methyltransferase